MVRAREYNIGWLGWLSWLVAWLILRIFIHFYMHTCCRICQDFGCMHGIIIHLFYLLC
jgi:hypothetical protein